MNSLLRLCAGLLLGSLTAQAATQFEGKVVLSITSGEEAEQLIDYSIKSGSVRMDLRSEGGTMSMIVHSAKRQLIMLMADQQMYMVLPLEMPGGEGGEGGESPIKKTGRTTKILGYTCAEWVMVEESQTTAFWVTDQLGSFVGLGSDNPMGGMGGEQGSGRAWESALKKEEGFFPLRVITRDSQGQQTFRLEARQLVPGRLPESLFSPPRSWQKFEMPQGGALPGMGG